MAITRTTLLAGPAAAVFNGHTFFAHDGILVSPALEIDSVDSDAQGVLDATVSGEPVKITFTPSAPFADLIALYPHLEGNPGASLFGAADIPLVLIAANGVRLTFSAVAILVMPDLSLTSRGPVAGAVTFLALGARGGGRTSSNRFVTIDTATPVAAPQGTPQLADDFAITWGGGPWGNLRVRDGVKIHLAMKTKPVFSDANALLDLTLEQLEAEARFIPVTPAGPDEGDVVSALALQGATALPGRSLAAAATALDIAGEHLFVRLPGAQLVAGEMSFDAVRSRLGELRFVSTRAFLEAGVSALVSLTEGEP